MMTKDEIINALREFKEHRGAAYGIITLGVFGSVARGEQDAQSDIDVCVRLKDGTLFTLYALKDELEDLFRRRVDVISLGAIMRPLFRKSIEQDVIYI